ncbi:unnamed protein product [Dovyalis caffra]|uniref:Uncharacterized protein n=1 Tax=Dovyalis caffra TaxID=77055 RepID=A0AAV1RTJ8_9ROSI|nr:unnamed protein product [Dovyalis caffra]
MAAGGFVTSDVENYPEKVTWDAVIACILGAMVANFSDMALEVQSKNTNDPWWLHLSHGGIINAVAVDILVSIAGRILIGLGVGFTTQNFVLFVLIAVCASYLLEMAPSSYCGAFTNIPGGLGWQISLGSAPIPALFISGSAFFLPNTPNSFLELGKTEKAREKLRQVRSASDNDIEPEFQALVNVI